MTYNAPRGSSRAAVSSVATCVCDRCSGSRFCARGGSTSAAAFAVHQIPALRGAQRPPQHRPDVGDGAWRQPPGLELLLHREDLLRAEPAQHDVPEEGVEVAPDDVGVALRRRVADRAGQQLAHPVGQEVPDGALAVQRRQTLVQPVLQLADLGLNASAVGGVDDLAPTLAVDLGQLHRRGPHPVGPAVQPALTARAPPSARP